MMKKKSFSTSTTVTVTATATAAVVIGLTVLMMMLTTMTTVYDLLGIHPIQPKLLVLDHHSTVFIKHRKLLAHSTVEPNRIWGDKCSTSDIMVIQGPTGPLPSGIPTYTVEIMNVCPNGCNISQIHLSCGWFSSARLVNPKIFKRLRPDDCLVNGGKTLFNGRTLSFQYANTFPYPLAVSSVHC